MNNIKILGRVVVVLVGPRDIASDLVALSKCDDSVVG